MDAGGRHTRFAGDPAGMGSRGKFRFLLRPTTAMGIALVVVVLTLVGVVRAFTWEGHALSEASSSSPPSPSQSNVANEVQSRNDSVPKLGYGLSVKQGEGSAISSGGMIVHVVGAVREPGVVELPAGARVLDAIEKAGGAKADADVSGINLAAFAADGTQIYVPTQGEVIASSAGSAPGSAISSSSGSGCIDLNNASEAELEGLDGVGPKLAARIVEYRQNNGPYMSSSDLMAVPGIGAILSQRIAVGACQ